MTKVMLLERKAALRNLLMLRNIVCNASLYDVGLGGLGVTCSPPDPRFAGLNPAEVDGFFQGVKILSTCLPGGI